MNNFKKWRAAPTWRQALPYLGFVLFVMGMKLLLITHFANATPYWDQWDAEASLLYRPWLEGTLTIDHLFSGHNEHRILLTRLVNLILFELNDHVWDPILQMQVNAGLHVITLCTLIYFISGALNNQARRVLIIFSAIIFSIPYAWENTLVGFQSPFYFLLLCCFIFLWSIVRYKPYTSMWYLGFLFGLLGIFSIASGVVALFTGIVLLTLKSFYNKTNSKPPIFAILTLLAIVICVIALTPNLPYSASPNNHSFRQFFHAFTIAASWPTSTGGWIIIQLPITSFMARFFVVNREKSTSHWFILALGIWLFGQIFILAFGRAEVITSSRYLDILAIGLILNFTCILLLLSDTKLVSKKIYYLMSGCWIMFVVLNFGSLRTNIRYDLEHKAQQSLAQEQNVRAYIISHDSSYLVDKPIMELPYPDPSRLKALLDEPTIAKILPENIALSNVRENLSLIKRIMERAAELHVYWISSGITLFFLDFILIIMIRKRYKERNDLALERSTSEVSIATTLA
jgi:hypothetical protein